MIVVVTGSRDWTDTSKIEARLSSLPKSAVIVHGGCRGADLIADAVAKKLGMETITYPADWEKHGKAAGPIRNRQMLDLKPDIVLAFHEDLSKSKGTKDCAEEAKKRDLKVEVIS